MEGAVMRVAELDVGEPFVGRHETVADYLDLGLVGDGLEVGVEDGFAGDRGLVAVVAVAVEGGGERIEALGELVLGARGDVGLGLDDEDLVGEEGGAEDGEIGICFLRKDEVVSTGGGNKREKKARWKQLARESRVVVYLTEEVTDFNGYSPMYEW